MPRCIFCKSDTASFTTREHILPESLGGGDWALLSDGLFCDRCQNRFGSEIEQKALGDYPFSFLRVLLGIPTKKRKAPWLESWEGVLRAGPKPGQLGYDPAPSFEKATNDRSKTVMRLLACPQRPEMICRTLLKMAIEIIANDDPVEVFQERYDAARRFALEGKKDGGWWYLQREDMETASRLMTVGMQPDDWVRGIELTTSRAADDDDAEVFQLHLFYLDLIVPIEPRILPPPMTDLPEPEYRLFSI